MNNKDYISITTSNSKLGGFIPQLNLPPIITCRKNCPCANLCYGRKGNFNYERCKKGHIKNLEAYQKDKTKYFNTIIKYLNNGFITYKYFRWHSTGDIIDKDYFDGVILVAKKCKKTKFLIFTKKFEIVNDYIKNNGEIPKNLTVIFSAWDKNFYVPNPYKLPIAYINFKNKDLNPQLPITAIECKGHCDKCLGCWQLRNGQSVILPQH